MTPAAAAGGLSLAHLFGDARQLAEVVSWEWERSTDQVVILHGMPVAERAGGSRATLDALLLALPAEIRSVCVRDLAELTRGDRDEVTRRVAYHTSRGAAWVEARSRAIRNADGTLLGINGAVFDVTEPELDRQGRPGRWT